MDYLSFDAQDVEGEHYRRDVYERSGQTIAPRGRCKSTANVKSFELSLFH